MSLYSNWEETTSSFSNEKVRDAFWNDYLEQEKKMYQIILSENIQSLEGTYNELRNKFQWPEDLFIGFLDGINTSLSEPLDLESIHEDTFIEAHIDFERLYLNMLDYKADWLYTLDEWDNIFDKPFRADLKKQYNRSKTVVKGEKIGRNDSCPCGSGKKYKKCCLNKTP